MLYILQVLAIYLRKSLIAGAFFSTICHFPHSCERVNCGSEVHGKDEILSRGIPVHWRSCVRNTLFSVSGFKRTTPHFLVWAESAVNFQNNTDVFLVVQLVMAKSAVENPQSPTTTKTRLSSCSWLHSVCLLVVYLQKISTTEELLYFKERGKVIFSHYDLFLFIFRHTSVRREYKLLFSFNIYLQTILFCAWRQRAENKTNSEKRELWLYFLHPLPKNTTKNGKNNVSL